MIIGRLRRRRRRVAARPAGITATTGIPEITGITDVTGVTDITDITDITDVTDVTDDRRGGWRAPTIVGPREPPPRLPPAVQYA